MKHQTQLSTGWGAGLLALCGLLALAGAISSPGATAAKAQEPSDAPGRGLFLQHCSRCHGVHGKGGEGPSLALPHLRNADSDDDLALVIRLGIPQGGMPGTRHLSKEDVALLVTFVRSLGRVEAEPVPGDAASGAIVYEDNSCEACHILDGVGIHVGPELTTIGLRRAPAHLRESLLDPRARVPAGYEFLRARLGDSATIEGLLINEDAFSVQIRDASGRFHSVEKAELEGLDRMPKRSIMRTYRGRLSSRELDDLVAFLATRRGDKDDARQAP